MCKTEIALIIRLVGPVLLYNTYVRTIFREQFVGIRRSAFILDLIDHYIYMTKIFQNSLHIGGWSHKTAVCVWPLILTSWFLNSVSSGQILVKVPTPSGQGFYTSYGTWTCGFYIYFPVTTTTCSCEDHPPKSVLRQAYDLTACLTLTTWPHILTPTACTLWSDTGQTLVRFWSDSGQSCCTFSSRLLTMLHLLQQWGFSISYTMHNITAEISM